MLSRINSKGSFTASQLSLHLNWIYIGNLSDAQNVTELESLGITHVLTVAGLDVSKELYYPFIHFKADIADHPSAEILKVAPECISFIQDCYKIGGKILIHCASGISRSVTICVVYLMVKCDLSYEESLSIVENCRPGANPNVGFRHQLKLLERHSKNITMAASEFHKQSVDGDILACIASQRERCNQFHRRADEYELEIKSKRLSSIEKTSIVEGLRQLNEEIIFLLQMLSREGQPVPIDSTEKERDTAGAVVCRETVPDGGAQPLHSDSRSGVKSASPSNRHGTFSIIVEDKVADMIIRSALSKCQRLKEELESSLDS